MLILRLFWRKIHQKKPVKIAENTFWSYALYALERRYDEFHKNWNQSGKTNIVRKKLKFIISFYLHTKRVAFRVNFKFIFAHMRMENENKPNMLD
jgi:hypothetical protein